MAYLSPIHRNLLWWWAIADFRYPTAAHDGTIGGRMRNRLSTMPVVAPARAPIAAPVGATPGTPVATSGGTATGLLLSAEARGEGADGAAPDQLGGTDNEPMDVDWPRPADIDEPEAPSPARPEIPCPPELRPAVMPSGATAPSPPLPAE